ncbi:MAG: RNA polymerase-binding protein RbpA [Aquiluna sp.]|nr:RNA polymerase-binding protein RbpA [Aquiluna sp.]
MMSGSPSIRGARVGAGPMGEQDRGHQVEKIALSFYCSNGHVTHPLFAASVNEEDIPTEIDCPHCGLPSGTDKENPPVVAKIEPYKTHLAYVKERRTDDEAEQILAEALDSIRNKRQRAAEAAKARR